MYNLEEMTKLIDASRTVGKIYAGKVYCYLTLTLQDGSIKNTMFPLNIYGKINQFIQNSKTIQEELL